jgi:hypothetical protein
MAILNNSNAISPSGYDVNNSLRLRSSATAYLNRTPASSGNRQIFTFSAWVKRGSLGIVGTLLSGGATAGTGTAQFIGFDTDNTFFFSNYNVGNLQTTQVFRDPSAWYHMVIAIDTTQATAANRIKMYVNGSQITAFSSSTYPSQNTNLYININEIQTIGRASWSSLYLFDGYLAEVNFVDGQQLTPSDFGSTDTTTGVWKPKAYSGTYGTNGFYLKFSDIATTSGSNAGLGKDFSGNTNYWTTNNISVTSGTTYDAMKDSPTNTSATVANYAVLNPLRSYSSVTIAGGNLNYSASYDGSSVATIGMDSGKYYWEVTLTNSNTAMLGLNKMTEALSGFVGYSSGSYGYYSSNGNKFNNNVSTSYGNSYTNGDVIGVAFDATNGKLFFSKNGTWQNSGDPAAGTNAAFTGLTGDTYVPAVGHGTMAAAMNFGQRPFAYTPPTGFVALNTYNLPTPTILQGNKYMDATLYTGNGSSRTVTNAGAFKTDLVWVKSRSNSGTWHILADSVRGAGYQLSSNQTNAEIYDAQGVGFASNGFTLGADTIDAYYGWNINGDTYVGWQWQAGQGSTSSNTQGSITSTVSVNTTAGFSVVTYTGTGANATVGHGLGVAPKMTIIKKRGATGNWIVGHIGATNWNWYLTLNSTAAQTGDATMIRVQPDINVVYLGTNTDVNASSATYVMYNWAEIAGFSKFGSYTGNGSTDGPFVFTNLKPRFIMIKRTDTTSNWTILDTAREGYNVDNDPLYPNLSDAEGTTDLADILSNGFKLRSTDASVNANTGTYIYACFSSNPFKNSTAV